jgi:hypothetical protein
LEDSRKMGENQERQATLASANYSSNQEPIGQDSIPPAAYDAVSKGGRESCALPPFVGEGEKRDLL